MLFLACLLTYTPVDPNPGLAAKAPRVPGTGLNSDAKVTGSMRPRSSPRPRPQGPPAARPNKNCRGAGVPAGFCPSGTTSPFVSEAAVGSKAIPRAMPVLAAAAGEGSPRTDPARPGRRRRRPGAGGGRTCAGRVRGGGSTPPTPVPAAIRPWPRSASRPSRPCGEHRPPAGRRPGGRAGGRRRFGCRYPPPRGRPRSRRWSPTRGGAGGAGDRPDDPRGRVPTTRRRPPAAARDGPRCPGPYKNRVRSRAGATGSEPHDTRAPHRRRPAPGDRAPRRLRRVVPDPAAVRGAIRPDLDWAYLVRAAHAHRVTPLVYRTLAACPGAVPPAALDRLREAYHATARRNLALAGELVQLLAALDARGVRRHPVQGAGPGRDRPRQPGPAAVRRPGPVGPARGRPGAPGRCSRPGATGGPRPAGGLRGPVTCGRSASCRSSATGTGCTPSCTRPWPRAPCRSASTGTGCGPAGCRRRSAAPRC